jgi:hypothetical protein
MVEDHIVRYKRTSNKLQKMALDNKLNKKKKQQTNLYHLFFKVPRKACQQVPRQACKNVPKQQCQNVPRQVR